MIVDRAIYRDGRRTATPESVDELFDAYRDGGGLACIALYQPSADEFAAVAHEFELPALAVANAVTAHQRPKLERYKDMLFLVLRPARFIDETETVEFDEVQVFAGPQFVITVRHGNGPDLALVRQRLESRPDLLQRGTVAIVNAILGLVVDGYEPVVAGIENDIDEIEDDVFDGSPHISQRIYELAREVILFQRATKPLASILDELMHAPPVDDEEHHYLRAVRDHALHVQEQAAGFRELLQNILSVNLTLETKALGETSNARTRGSRRSPRGRRSCSPPRQSARSTA